MSEVKRDRLGKRESSQLPYKLLVLLLSVFFIHIVVFMYFTEVPSQPVHLLLWSGLSHFSVSFCPSFLPRPCLMIDFFCQAAPFGSHQL